DGIEQNDRRLVYGGDLGWRQAGRLGGMDGAATAGVQVRVDDIPEIRLGTQTTRMRTGTTIQNAVYEASYSPYLKLEAQPLSWMRLVGGVRGDYFTFDVRNTC